MEEQRFYLWENFYLSKSALKRDSWDKLESYGILTVKYAQTKVMFGLSGLNAMNPLSRITALSYRLIESSLLKGHWRCVWCVITDLSWPSVSDFLPPSSHRDQPDPREKRYASIWISKAFLDKSMHCTSVFRTFIYGQKVLGQPCRRPPTFEFSLRVHQKSRRLHLAMRELMCLCTFSRQGTKQVYRPSAKLDDSQMFSRSVNLCPA